MKIVIFDYSLICFSIYQQEKREIFIKDLNTCDNKEIKCLFHAPQIDIDSISKIITNGFVYPRRSKFGIGIYFTDMLDYASFLSRNETSNSKRNNFGQTIPIGITFSFVGTIVFYNKEKKKNIYDYYYYEDLDHSPTYEEIKANYPRKIVEKDGVHFARVYSCDEGVYNNNNEKLQYTQRNGLFIGNEYIITEKKNFYLYMG